MIILCAKIPGKKAAEVSGKLPQLFQLWCLQINYASETILSSSGPEGGLVISNVPLEVEVGGRAGEKVEMGCCPLWRLQSTLSLVWGF